MKTKRTGILLLNLGTPSAPNKSSVRRFLREFLSDPYVIDLPKPLSALLLYGIILPFRTKMATEAYQKIWTKEGSPLMVHSQALTTALQNHLDENYVVKLAMRYGTPSIETSIQQLISAPIDEMIVLPLYPQYATSTTASSIQKTKMILTKKASSLPVTFLNAFYNHPNYISANIEILKSHLTPGIEKIIFSYHGLPERHIHKTCFEKKHCDLSAACPLLAEKNENCYRAQCYATSQLIAKQLGLKPNQYTVSFQSRLGKAPWISPYTDETLNHLASNGIKNIAIACPSFVSDCLETLEEIDIRAKAQWQALGGQQFIRIPCLNSHNSWINALKTMIIEHQKEAHS